MAQRFGLPTLYITAFAAGAATLGLETAAARIIGTGFGTSNVVWTSVIGVVLVTMAVGSWLAGSAAHRPGAERRLVGVLALAGLWCGAVPMLSRTVGDATSAAWYTAELGVIVAVVSVAFVLFGVPVIAFGCVLPWTVGLAARSATDAGRVAGRLNAVSTLGAVLGTFVPTFVLIPTIGTVATFLTIAVLVTALAVWGMARCRQWKRAFLVVTLLTIVVACELATGPHRSAPPVGTVLLHETESTYNTIRVGEVRSVPGLPAGTRLLWVNNNDGIQSVYEPEPSLVGYWPMFAAAPFFNPRPYDRQELRRICIVGLAAGTVARMLTRLFDQRVQIDGFEIDARLLDVGRQWFDLSESNVRAAVVDGRVGLQRAQPGQYDLIVVDVFRGPEVPWHLATREFFALAKSRLSARGVLAMNTTRRPWPWMQLEDRSIVDAISATLRTVFPTVHTVDVPVSFNTMLVATPTATTLADFTSNVEQAQASALHAVLQRAVAGIRPTSTGAQVLTDDRTNLEALLNAAVLPLARR